MRRWAGGLLNGTALTLLILLAVAAWHEALADIEPMKPIPPVKPIRPVKPVDPAESPPGALPPCDYGAAESSMQFLGAWFRDEIASLVLVQESPKKDEPKQKGRKKGKKKGEPCGREGG